MHTQTILCIPFFYCLSSVAAVNISSAGDTLAYFYVNDAENGWGESH